MKQFVYYILILLSSFIVSCKQVSLEEADQYFSRGEYYAAAEMYSKLYSKTQHKNKILKGKIAFRAAESFRIANMPLQARTFYLNACRNNAEDNTLPLQYARVLHKTGDYDKAVEMYKQFLKLYPNNKFALNGLKGATLAKKWRASPTRYKVDKVQEISSTRGGEFSPMLLPPSYKQLYFTSNRKESKTQEKSKITGVKNNDIYITRKDNDGNWLKPEKMESQINTDFDEGVVSFNPDGAVMYYTFSPQDSLNSSLTSIYKSYRSGGVWTKGKLIKLSEDSTAVYAHPAISPSGDVLYFVSDLPSGYGGKDIWRAYLSGDKVKYIENLGPEINTAGDEMFPYVKNDSTLYFSSDGHPGMGGLDIFKATYNKHDKQWNIENLKSPINSEGDDFGITFEGDIEKGFFSSNRGEARGWDRIYSFEYPVMRISIEGYIVDTDDEFLPEITIHAIGSDGTNTKVIGKSNGTYTMKGEAGVNYVFLASGNGYLSAKMSLQTKVNVVDSTYLVDFILTPINKPVLLENIYFDFDKTNLRSDSRYELDQLIILLKDNPHITIELSAHTDRHGSDEYNQKLSQLRAQSVINYLIKAGIEQERLLAKGYGKTQPKIITKSILKKYNFFKEKDILSSEYVSRLSPQQQNIADKINRRIEFKVSNLSYRLSE